MTRSFKDLFSSQSQCYAQYRPTYPAEFFEYIASQCPCHQRAWDCATGNGQAAKGLKSYFDKIIATDASPAQVQQAESIMGVTFKVALAEDSGLASESIDLVTVAQAFHWFRADAFAAEVDRVLKPEGVLAIWCYGLGKITPEIDAVVYQLYEPVLGNYWSPERDLVDRGYRGISMPFQKQDTPRFSMQSSWTMQHLAGYLSTWSALKRYEKEHNRNPIEDIWDDLVKAWGNKTERTVTWPLFLHLWRK